MMKIDKIFGDKKANTVIYILLAVGILMLVMSSAFSDSSPSSQVPEATIDTLSAQTERILSEIKGVGTVSVMISFGEDSTSQNEGILSSAKKENTSSVQSVLIVADGGGSQVIREKIVRAAKAALGVESHKIEVFERKEKQ